MLKNLILQSHTKCFSKVFSYLLRKVLSCSMLLFTWLALTRLSGKVEHLNFSSNTFPRDFGWSCHVRKYYLLHFPFCPRGTLRAANSSRFSTNLRALRASSFSHLCASFVHQPPPIHTNSRKDPHHFLTIMVCLHQSKRKLLNFQQNLLHITLKEKILSLLSVMHVIKNNYIFTFSYSIKKSN